VRRAAGRHGGREGAIANRGSDLDEVTASSERSRSDSRVGIGRWSRGLLTLVLRHALPRTTLALASAGFEAAPR
jgi:hypothetical protein